jgi:two-component system C4-dicarboxylate transport sensor histidine kinase DctB
MRQDLHRRALVLLVFLAAVAMFAGGVWRYGYVQALDQLAKRGESDMTLAADRLTGQLQLYQQLSVVTADHPLVKAVLVGADPGILRALLLRLSDKTAALDVLLVDQTGRVLASANQTEPEDLSRTFFVKRAQQGALGEAHGINLKTGQRAYYFAAPVFAPSDDVQGALIVVANVGRVEAEWRGARPAVFFTDASGEVFITNRSELLFWQRTAAGGLTPMAGPEPEFRVRETAGHEIWLQRWSPYVPDRALHLSRHLPVIGLTVETMLDVRPARGLAWLQATVVAAVCLAFGALLFLATERRRTLAIANMRLESRVAERTAELSQANLTLRHEVAERIAAESALKKAQADLVQAGKLSALGQMSAGISHELNQPLMAIQQFADNGAAFLAKERTDVAAQNLTRISAMAKRMARIIKNLRAFARQESEPVSRVDLTSVIEQALELSEARLRQEGVALDYSAPTGPVHVMGGDVRLGQVLVNLISNAVDAMAGRTDKHILIALRQEAGKVCLDVADTGPGIREPEKIFDPFYSTKEVGAEDGMGLGLSISYGLVQSFGGVIRGRNRPEGGAIFTVELTAAEGAQAA